MKKQSKSQYFVQMTNFLMGRFGFEKPIEISRDNRIDCPCCVAEWDNPEKIKIQYHSRRMGQCPKIYILNFLLHEIGHLINNMVYDTNDEIILSERAAEAFSVKVMKEEFPKLYNKMLKRMKEKRTLYRIFKEKKGRMPYYWAYKTIKEYKITTSKEDLLWLKNAEKKLKK